MSVVSYGSLVSLMQVLDQIQKHHNWGRIRTDVQQVQNFRDNVQFLQAFLEIDSQKLKKEDMEGLSPRIIDAAREAEIIIDHHIVDQMRGLYDYENDKGISAFRIALGDVVQVMNSIKEGLIKEIQRKRLPLSIHSHPVHSLPKTESSRASSGTSSTLKNIVGSVNQIVDKLTNDEKSLQVIPIVGMGGIGKTTLARCVFEDSRILNRFDRLKWCTISQEYNEQEVIQGLLDEKSNRVMPELGVQLHKELKSRRYLIVIDDMWNIEVWDRLKLFFPNDCNGSRVIVTTRLSNVASSIGSYSYQLDFLNDVESWVLFCEKAFGQQSCPANLEEFGKKIVRSCRGLPISIVTIGGLLSKSNMTPGYWEFVAQNATQITSSGDDERCLKILYLSYDNLPIHLKLCFLDFENYPEDKGIRASELIRNWISLGLVKSVSGQRIEDIAEGNLNELTNRNLIFVRDRKYSGKIKSYGIHDLLRELCIKESEQENLIHNTRSRSLKREILLLGKEITSDDQCFMCDASKGVDAMEMVPASRSTTGVRHSRSSDYVPSFCGGCKMEYSDLMRSRWVTLFDNKFRYPTQSRVLQQYFGRGSFCSPSPILFLWNLQTIYIQDASANYLCLPIEILEMQQLRHLMVLDCVLRVPAIAIGGKEFTVLEELQTLHIQDPRFTHAIVQRMPNIRELRIAIIFDEGDYPRCGLDNVSFFTQLQSLTIEIWYLKSVIFPRSLKKLRLIRCRLCCDDMDVIGSLPDLREMKLQYCEFEDKIWSPVEGKFLQLKVLKMSSIDLSRWEAEQDHFPGMERLCLEHMESMEEIPCDIANIPTLISIDLLNCSEEIIESGKRILEEQQNLGNWDLKIYVYKSGRRCQLA